MQGGQQGVPVPWVLQTNNMPKVPLKADDAERKIKSLKQIDKLKVRLCSFFARLWTENDLLAGRRAYAAWHACRSEWERTHRMSS